jgi:hypothetical protein
MPPVPAYLQKQVEELREFRLSRPHVSSKEAQEQTERIAEEASRLQRNNETLLPLQLSTSLAA